MRAPVLLGVLLVVSAARGSAAQSGESPCPAPGTQFTYSDGAHIEAVSDQGNYVCRFKNLKTQKTFDRLFGSFTTTGPNTEQIRALAPLEVGRKISFTSSGAGDRGTDGFWFTDVSVERLEKVVTTAGTFSAFVILYDEKAGVGSTGRWRYRYWYSPDVKHAVKFDFHMSRGNPPTKYPKDWELTAYQPGGAPRSTEARPPPLALVPAAAAPPPVPPLADKPAQTGAPPAPPAIAPPSVAAAVAVSGAQDGTWQMEMQVTTTYGTTVGGECQTRPSIPVTFVKGIADGPSAKLQVTRDGGISGWMLVPSLGTSMLPFIVNVSGRAEDGVFAGSVSGRCTGSFTMRKQ